MSTFRVYGMTECKAMQLARASTPPHPLESVEEFEARVQERFKKIMEGNRAVPLSSSFDAPQFANQFIEIAQRSGRARGLHIRHPVKVHVLRGKKPATRTVWKEYKQ
ncbi:hypothetical protein SAMN04487958_107160 [Vreelandella subterranea]|uniref:Uncharacterized protein n=1 Tax=Vreelandella subterranea TaxID=416874 RepID=A0A1H9URS1_9GAMM|nr:hypothetical protein [Halomonas subterranea]SES11747.1 hypothetical protein SAMN04487958_107160 [Halomonas subterranea]